MVFLIKKDKKKILEMRDNLWISKNWINFKYNRWYFEKFVQKIKYLTVNSFLQLQRGRPPRAALGRAWRKARTKRVRSRYEQQSSKHHRPKPQCWNEPLTKPQSASLDGHASDSSAADNKSEPIKYGSNDFGEQSESTYGRCYESYSVRSDRSVLRLVSKLCLLDA